MIDLAQWLEHNMHDLVGAAVTKLSANETLKSEAVESIEAFYDGLLRSAITHSEVPLNTILIDWIESSSAPSEDELGSFVSVLATLKLVTWEQILLRSQPHESPTLLLAADTIFTHAIVYLSRLEGESLIADMRSQLHKAQAHVKRLDKSKSNFIAVAAHELRTPLTLVEGYADMIANSGWAANEPQAALLLEGIDGGTRRLREIIDDMIDVSLLDLKIMELHFQPAWLHQLLSVAERNVMKVLGQRQVQIIIQYDTIPSQSTVADPDRMLQVFQKVLSNAVKYTPDGGTVIVHGRELPGFTDIMIEDNGIGISPANLPHIFDTFSGIGDAALHSSGKTKFKGGGPGLGLPIAKGIVEAHGGTIWAESDGYDEQKYPGSTFHIMIPMQSASSDDKIINSVSLSFQEDEA